MVTPPSQGATPLNQEHILPKQAATPLHKVGTPLHKAAILQQQGATPHRQVDTHPRLAVSLLQLEVTPQQQGATLPRLVVTLPQLEVSHLNQDTNRSLEQAVIPPCPQQAEAGAPHPVATVHREELSRDTLGDPLLASPRQITPEPPPQTPQCLDMGGERHLILRHLPSLKATGALLKTFQGLTLSGMLKFSVKP